MIYRRYLDQVLSRSGPFTDEEWMPGDETIRTLEDSKVLFVHGNFSDNLYG